MLASVAVALAATAASLATAPAAVPGDNGRITFTSDRDGNLEVYTMNPDGSRQRNRSANPANDLESALSPDATKIVFRSVRDGNPEIYAMNATGTAQTRLTSNAVEDIQPEVSPDGTQIAFARREEGNFTNADIYVMGIDGSSPTKVTTNTGSDTEPAFSPDGTRIAFVTGRNGTNDVYVIGTNGSGEAPLTTDPGNDLQPAFSPDGTMVAFSSDRIGADREIYVMDAADGGNVTRLTTSAGDDSQPVFSPDGTKIAFTSARDGNPEIYVMNADGSNPTRITTDPASDFDPYWTKASAAPQNTSAPSIPTAATTGDVLTCDPGAWSGSPAFVFEWLRDGSPVAGVAAQAYTVTADDIGHQIVCRVTATTAADVDAQADSNTVVPAVTPPAVTPPPGGKPAPTPQEEALATAAPSKVATAFGLPTAKRCVSRRRFAIHLRKPAGVSIATAKVLVNGKGVRTRKVKGRFTAIVDLRGLPKGRFTVAIRVVTVSGKTLRGSRRYRTCRSRRLAGNNHGPL